MTLALALALPAHAMSTSSLVGLDTFCIEVQPQVLAATYTAPSPGEVWARGDIAYTVGGALDVTLTIPQCTHVASVSFAGVALQDFEDVIDGGNYYEVLTTTATAAGVEVVVRLHYFNAAQGYSPTIAVGLASEAGTLTAIHPFTLAQVADIGDTVPLMYTDELLMNQFTEGAFGDFGDDDTWVKVEDDNSSRTYHSIDYSVLDIHVQDDGIHVAYEFQADVDNWCDPTISLDGRFHLDFDTAGVFVVWDEGAEASLDTAWYCDWSTLFFGDVVIGWVAPDAGASFEERVEEEISSAFGDADCGGVNCANFITTIAHTDGAIVVNFQPPAQTVDIDVPYDVDRLDNADSMGLAVAAGDRIAVVAGGSAEACTDDLGLIGSCPTHTVTPTGLFEWHTDAPIPDDWYLAGTQWVYNVHRDEARALLSGFDRNPAEVRVADLPVGRLLMTEGDDRDGLSNRTARDLFDVSSACALAVQGTPGTVHTVVFAPNDQEADNLTDLGSGSYRVSVGIDGVPSGVGDCPVAAVEATLEALDSGNLMAP